MLADINISRHKLSLISLFDKIKRLKLDRLSNRLLALEIQEELIVKITRSEQAIRKFKAEIKQSKFLLSDRSNSKETSKQIKIKVEKLEYNLSLHRRLIWVFKSVGDCIPFIYGNRWDLKQLFLKQDAGFISGKKGSRLERSILRGAFAKGGTIVLNDLTNTLRYGDLALFWPDAWPDGDSPFILFEAKSGRKKDDRSERQMKAANEVMKYIHTDTKITDNQTWARVSAYESPTDHIATINRLISALPSNGFISEKVEAGLYYLVLDCKIDERSLDNAMSSVLTKEHLPFSLTVNDLKEEALGYVPFGLSLDSENYFNFLNGEFIIFVIVDMNELNRMVAENNITIEFSDRDESPWKISPLKVKDENNDAQIFIGSHVLGRLAAEFITLNWLVKNIVLGPGVDEIKKVIENSN